MSSARWVMLLEHHAFLLFSTSRRCADGLTVVNSAGGPIFEGSKRGGMHPGIHRWRGTRPFRFFFRTTWAGCISRHFVCGVGKFASCAISQAGSRQVCTGAEDG